MLFICIKVTVKPKLSLPHEFRVRGQTFSELATQMCTMKDVWVSGSENSFLFGSSSLAILHGGYLSCYLPQGNHPRLSLAQ